MPGSSVHTIQTVFLLLLVSIAVFALIARLLRVAYPIVLVLAGLLISLLPGIPRVPLSPDLVFLVFLPPLLYVSATNTSWRDFRENLTAISLLAFGLVAFTVWGVAEFSDRFITALDWKSGFLLGAVVAATDAVAATSIASSLGLPRRVVDILEGESLLNDATSLLALEFGLQMLTRNQAPSLHEGLLRLFWLTAGGLGAGAALGWLVTRAARLLDDAHVELVVSLLVPYAAYLAGEAMHASGFIAVVAAGLWIGHQSPRIHSPSVRLQIRGVWNALEFILNGIVFVLIGLQLPLIERAVRGIYPVSTLLLYAGAFSAILIALRLLWTFSATYITRALRDFFGKRRKSLDPKSVFVVGWTGMRGVVALAAAISLPHELAPGKPFTAYSLIIFLAFCVILVTLVLQGLTLPPLIRALQLSDSGNAEQEEREARLAMLHAAVHLLEDQPPEIPASLAHVVRDQLHRLRHRLALLGEGEIEDELQGLDDHALESIQQVRSGVLRIQRETLIALRDEDRINDATLRTLERELDLVETRHGS